MARAAFPATTVNLMLSDVVGDKMDVIASGPFVPDLSSFEDALGIFEKYKLKHLPESISTYIERGLAHEVPETPKVGDPIFDRVYNFIIGSNILAAWSIVVMPRRIQYVILSLRVLPQHQKDEKLCPKCMNRESNETKDPTGLRRNTPHTEKQN